MISFILAIAALVVGYIFYGRFVEKSFGSDSSKATPAVAMTDGVDYIPMPAWKVFLIQFLNIAGTGPIFGAIMGILFGPMAYLWIVFGSIFIGGVHDYFSGMMSVRSKGASLPDIIGNELGPVMKLIMRLLSLLLLILVGTVFTTTSAGLLGSLTGASGFFGSKLFWIIVIFIYFMLATVLPIDTLIGRFYPIFGLALLIMAVGVMGGIFLHSGFMPSVTDAFKSVHPSGLPIFPLLFVTIACGAVSGFHGTQSPLMARCIRDEKFARPVFYGAMITEGVVALIWAAAAIKFSGSYDALYANLTDGGVATSNPAKLVNFICSTWMGKVGAVLAVLGVVAAPVTSGDTAFRSARLILADFMKIEQKKVSRRLLLAIPLFAISAILLTVNFDVLWRYFAWFNQTLAMIALWSMTSWQWTRGRNYWITLLPAVFMTMVSFSYILCAPEGFRLDYTLSYLISGAMTLCLTAFAVWRFSLAKKNQPINND